MERLGTSWPFDGKMTPAEKKRWTKFNNAFIEELKRAVAFNGWRLDLILRQGKMGWTITMPWITSTNKITTDYRPILAVAIPESAGMVHRLSPTLFVPGSKVTIKQIRQVLPEFLAAYYPEVTGRPVRIFGSLESYRAQKRPGAVLQPPAKTSSTAA